MKKLVRCRENIYSCRPHDGEKNDINCVNIRDGSKLHMKCLKLSPKSGFFESTKNIGKKLCIQPKMSGFQVFFSSRQYIGNMKKIEMEVRLSGFPNIPAAMRGLEMLYYVSIVFFYLETMLTTNQIKQWI